MSMITPRVPHLLQPYLSLPLERSLTLVTTVLSASSNWLLLRILLTTLTRTPPTPTITYAEQSASNGDSAGVVFVSFLRDWSFWKDTAKRVQCDLTAQSRNGRFTYVDGLTELFAGKRAGSEAQDGPIVLRDPDYKAIQQAVLQAVTSAQAKTTGLKVLLIVDGLDLLPAATGQDTETLLDVVATWRQHAHATLITASADSPLIQAPRTPLELDHAAFATSLAHQARAVISLRLLSTGVAKDVSGVLRITKGPGADDQDIDDFEEKEVLYFVGGDGNVKVFERGGGN